MKILSKWVGDSWSIKESLNNDNDENNTMVVYIRFTQSFFYANKVYHKFITLTLRTVKMVILKVEQ